jgi:hypothetical protein
LRPICSCSPRQSTWQRETGCLKENIISNSFYNPSGAPATHGAGSSAVIRAEFASISGAFDKLPITAGSPLALIRVNAGGTALEVDTRTYLQLSGGTLSGGLTISAGGLTISAAGLSVAGVSALVGNTTVTGALGVTGAVSIGGQLYGSALHNGGSVAGVANQYIASGTYTPSAQGTNNTTALAPNPHQWLRVGNVVTVSGSTLVTPQSGGGTSTTFEIILPIASTFSVGDLQLAGAGAALQSPAGTSASVQGNSATKRAQIAYSCTNGGVAANCTYHFTYLVT